MSFFRSNKKYIAIVVIALAATIFIIKEANLYRNTKSVLEATTKWSRDCIADDHAGICMALRSTKRNLDEYVEKLIWPLSALIRNREDYKELNETLWPATQPYLTYADNKTIVLDGQFDKLKEDGRRLDVADQLHADSEARLKDQYYQLGSPKILYRCRGDLYLLASKNSFLNYNSILDEAIKKCAGSDFSIVLREK